MVVLHYDNGQIREVELESFARINEWFLKTDKGPLFAGSLFPVEMQAQLENHAKRIIAAKKALLDVEGEMHTLMNASAPWRAGK